MRIVANLLIATILLTVANWSKAHILETEAEREHALPTVVPTFAVARTLALGMTPFAADMVWLRALEYFGDRRNKIDNFAGVVPLLERVVDLDPKFCIVYRKAGLIFTTNEIMALDRADQLLRRGVLECPDDYFIPFVLGFNLFYFQKRFTEAADMLELAATRPDAPAYAAELATRLRSQGGDLEGALAFLFALRDNETNEEVLARLDERIMFVRTEAVLRTVDAAISRIRASGRSVTSLADLAGEKLPSDPSGGTIVIRDGRAYSSSFERRLDLKDDALK